MIETLTPEQTEKFPDYIKKYTDIGLCTDKADRPRAEKAIRDMYKVSKLDEPKIVWCESPLGAYLTILIVDNLQKEELHSVGDSVSSSVHDSVRYPVWHSVLDSVMGMMGDWVRNSVFRSVSVSVKDSMRGLVGASVRKSVRTWVGDSVMDSVKDSVKDSVRIPVRNSVWASVRNLVWASVLSSVRNSVRNSVRDSVRDSVLDILKTDNENLTSQINQIYQNCIEGQHLSNISAFYMFFRNECGLTQQTENGLPLYDLIESCGWIFPYKNICFASERHCELRRNNAAQLHSENDCAVAYPGGYKIYAINGVRVPEYVVMTPEKITIKLIEEEKNVEVKRIMISRYKKGYESYIQDSGATLIDEKQDIHTGFPLKLWKKERPNDTAIVMVEMINKTKELNDEGQYVNKSYYIRVKPDITCALTACAWHQNQSLEDYLLTQKGT